MKTSASKPFFDGIKSTKFVAMKDSDYDIIRKLVAAEKAAEKAK